MRLLEVVSTSCMRKSARRKAQISKADVHFAQRTDLCFAICLRLSQVVYTSNLAHNLFFYFQSFWVITKTIGYHGRSLLPTVSTIILKIQKIQKNVQNLKRLFGDMYRMVLHASTRPILTSILRSLKLVQLVWNVTYFQNRRWKENWKRGWSWCGYGWPRW